MCKNLHSDCAIVWKNAIWLCDCAIVLDCVDCVWLCGLPWALFLLDSLEKVEYVNQEKVAEMSQYQIKYLIC